MPIGGGRYLIGRNSYPYAVSKPQVGAHYTYAPPNSVQHRARSRVPVVAAE